LKQIARDRFDAEYARLGAFAPDIASSGGERGLDRRQKQLFVGLDVENRLAGAHRQDEARLAGGVLLVEGHRRDEAACVERAATECDGTSADRAHGIPNRASSASTRSGSAGSARRLVRRLASSASRRPTPTATP
jgi:hypothetical protein